MKILVRNAVVCPDVVEARDARCRGEGAKRLTFAAELVDELAFPEQHDVLLVLRRFFLQSG